MNRPSIMITAFLAIASIISFTYPVLASEKDTQTTIFVLFDNGVNSTLSERQAKSQMSLSDWMDNDLVRVFGRYSKDGYQAKLIENRKEFIPKPNTYLLTVKIIEYRPGSKAARIVVGFGAGGVTLKVHYELSANGTNAILTKDDSTYSGREWITAARKLNQNMAKVVTEKLGN
ncbi:MAG: DUF4410 domain-containing protein [Candidatus Omnitrophica bacterium]|nr:DUF4410 domain-containing protein [Candidatus Omnitrophota bacterium]